MLTSGLKGLTHLHSHNQSYKKRMEAIKENLQVETKV